MVLITIRKKKDSKLILSLAEWKKVIIRPAQSVGAIVELVRIRNWNGKLLTWTSMHSKIVQPKRGYQAAEHRRGRRSVSVSIEMEIDFIRASL